MDSGKNLRRKRRDGLFAFSPADSILVLISVAHVGFIVVVSLNLHELSVANILLLGAASVYLTCLNYQCISHNSIHNPFFVSKKLNRCFGLFNSICMGSPSSYNHVEHLVHHKYNNDVRDANGKTKDNLSIFRYGRDHQPEPFWRYSLTLFPRLAFTTDYSKRSRAITQEWMVLAVFGGCLALIDVHALLWYGTTAALGMCASAAENYCEHLNGIPGDRMRDSVSVYNRIYNTLWFNNGYHQEHHYRPGVHWLDMAKITPLLPPITERFCARFCHFTNVKRTVDYSNLVFPPP